MISKQQLRIFESFTPNIFREYAVKEIKVIAKEKSNNALTLALKKFKEENLIIEKRIGRNLLYKLNLDNEDVFYYLGIINNQKISNSIKETIIWIKKEIEKYTFFYSIVIFGSYAIGKQTKKSDLDIAVFVENEDVKKRIQLALNSIKLKSILKIDPHAISQEEFLEMLKVDYQNLGKEIARKHLSISNHLIFYSLLNKGVKNGFSI